MMKNTEDMPMHLSGSMFAAMNLITSERV
jgi:hypothetical protein